MEFTVSWLRAGAVLGIKSFEELASAIRYAEDNLEGVARSFGATAVKVISVDGTPHYLRSLSR